MTPQTTSEITLDLLIHPWYGLSPDCRSPYGNSPSWYREVRELLSHENISAGMYADILLLQYLDHFAVSVDDPHYRVIFVEDDRSYLRSRNNLLEQQAKEILGERFIREARVEAGVSLFDVLPEVVKSSKINLRVYGEVSFLCVSAYSDFASGSLEELGLSVTSTILPELCGDLIDGKEKLF